MSVHDKMAAPQPPSVDPFNTPSAPGVGTQVGGYGHSSNSSGMKVM